MADPISIIGLLGTVTTAAVVTWQAWQVTFANEAAAAGIRDRLDDLRAVLDVLRNWLQQQSPVAASCGAFEQLLNCMLKQLLAVKYVVEDAQKLADQYATDTPAATVTPAPPGKPHQNNKMVDWLKRAWRMPFASDGQSELQDIDRRLSNKLADLHMTMLTAILISTLAPNKTSPRPKVDENDIAKLCEAYGGFDGLVAVLRSAATTAREHAVAALCNLVCDDKKYADRTVQAGGVEALVALLEAQHPPSLREQAALALLLLLHRDDDQRLVARIAAAGVAEPLQSLAMSGSEAAWELAMHMNCHMVAGSPNGSGTTIQHANSVPIHAAHAVNGAAPALQPSHSCMAAYHASPQSNTPSTVPHSTYTLHASASYMTPIPPYPGVHPDSPLWPGACPPLATPVYSLLPPAPPGCEHLAPPEANWLRVQSLACQRRYS